MPSVKTYQALILALGALILMTVSSCRVTRNFTPDQTLLRRIKIKVLNEQNVQQKQKASEDLKHVAAQQPNKRAFGFMPFKLWLYTAANHRKKDNKISTWVKTKVGEPPSIYDPDLSDKSDELMTRYLQNLGYLNAQVKHDTISKKKRTTLTYTVHKGPQWKFGNVTFSATPYLTDSITLAHFKLCKLRSGDKFDISTLKAERDRIDFDLKNSGFFFFSKEYVSFDLDTNRAPLTVDAVIRINQISDSVPHQQYWINEIYVTSDFGAELSTGGPVRRDTTHIDEYYFISHKKTVKSNVIRDAIFIKQDQLYSKDKYTKTVRTLSNLGAYKFVTVDYARAPDRDNYLNCIVNLTLGKKQSFNIEGQANISQEGYFGLSGLASYKDKNLTHRSDLLTIDFVPSVQFTFSKNKPVRILTEDYAPSASYYFNKFLFPMSKKLRESIRDKSPKTHLSIKYNYENRNDFDASGLIRPFYKLNGFNASWGYEWNRNAYIRHVLNPINFTIFLIHDAPYFDSLLSVNPTLKSSYEPQIIFGPSYTFTYSNQRTKTDKKYMFFRTSLETAGNVLMAGFALANLNRNTELPYKILEKEFSQYMRGEFDLRGYYRLDNHSMVAARSFFGIAVPYGNSTAVPFTKQFSVGGPTSLRGFEIREVGPGGYVNPIHDQNYNLGFFNQTGDMKMEANVELRFDIFKWFKGAIFTDVGNVWLLNKDAATPLGEFQFDRFWREFAIDVGPGLRLDFNYFVVRLDYGIPIRNPGITNNNKWFIHETNLGPGIFQLAVGYPF